MQYELTQEKFDLFKSGLYFSIQPDKIQKSKILTTSLKLHCSFMTNFKSEEAKSQKKRIYFVLLILISTPADRLHIHYDNVASYETLEKINISL